MIALVLDSNLDIKTPVFIFDFMKSFTSHSVWSRNSDGTEAEEEESFVDHNLPKSLNSDISYFGVGGKQAIFFIGNSTRVKHLLQDTVAQSKTNFASFMQIKFVSVDFTYSFHSRFS